MTCSILHKVLNNTGYENFEVLINDNGSTDKRLVPRLRNCKGLVFLKVNNVNKGIYWGLNQLLMRSSGYYYCKIDNDIELPNGWLKKLVDANQNITCSGISSIHCVQHYPPQAKLNGYLVRHSPTSNGSGTVFGMYFWNREVFNKIGFFNEYYGLYGGGDTDYCKRAIAADLKCYYIDGIKANHKHHVGEDRNSTYRKMKNEEIKKSMKFKNRLHRYYNETGNAYCSCSDICNEGIEVDNTNGRMNVPDIRYRLHEANIDEAL